MTLDTFFKKFDQFADAPDAVAKMREVILDLAVTGQLLEGQSKQGGKLKSGWQFPAFGEVAQFINGDRSKNYPSKSFRVDDGVPFINAGHLTDGDVGLDKMDYITHEHFQRLGSGKVEKGDVLYCLRGSLGKCAIVRSIDMGAIASSLIIIRPNEKLIAEFVYLFLISPLGSQMISKYDNGSAQPNLSATNVKKYIIPLPPLAEQKRIVAKVDELMALCDRLEAQQQERDEQARALARASLARFAEVPTPANLNLLFYKSYSISPAELRKALLTLAVRGRLLPQDPKDEPAEKLLESIGKQRAKLVGSDSLKKSKPCRQFSSDEAPHAIPPTWVWTMLGEITDIGTGSTPSRGETKFWTNGTIPWITSGSTSKSAITEGDEFVTAAAVKAHRLRIYPPSTLLVALYGQGKTRGQVVELNISATINQACAAICPLDGIPHMQSYIKLHLEKQYDEMRLQSAGGAQPNLNVQKIKEVFVSLPPIAEQHRIVAKVDQLMALVDQLETQLVASRDIAKNLLEALTAELTAA